MKILLFIFLFSRCNYLFSFVFWPMQLYIGIDNDLALACLHTWNIKGKIGLRFLDEE